MVHCYRCRTSDARFYRFGAADTDTRRLCDVCVKTVKRGTWLRTGRKYCEVCHITTASWGTELPNLTRCTKHKTKAMYQLRHWRRTCEGAVGCRGVPEYGLTANVPTRCARHADRCKHVTYRHTCASCSLFQVGVAGGLCSYCDGTSSRLKRQRRPEMAVVTALMAGFALTFQAADTTVLPPNAGGGCRAFRPDICFDCGTHAIVVEVDEHQHETLMASCEMSRMESIQQQLGLPTVFVRFNPHSWTTEAGKPGRCALPTRIDELIREVRHLHTYVPVDDLTVTFMFYDEGGKRRWAEMVN